MENVKLVLVAATLLAGCANYTASARPDVKASSDVAYLYGRFTIRTGEGQSRDSTIGLAGYQTMGLKLRCLDAREYTVRFLNENRVQVIAIRPSRCTLTGIVGTDADGILRAQAPPRGGWVHADDFAAGRAYYLGDFFAKATFASDAAYRHWGWDMDPDDDGFESTTAEFKNTFVNLASLPVADQRLAPRAPPLPPGAVGAPISPARAARIAPFTKRSYRTPAECEAACSMGKCLPYRGEHGTAMTCIVRCKVDKDCPEGLGCNCRHPEERECHAIAQTAADPMDGICLSTEPAPTPSQ